MKAFGLDPSRIDGIHPDIFWSKLLRQHTRDHIDGTLGGSVDYGRRRRQITRDGADIDHTAARRAKVLDRLLRRENQTKNIGIELPMKFILRHCFERFELIYAGVVNQNVELAECFLRLGKQALDV